MKILLKKKRNHPFLHFLHAPPLLLPIVTIQVCMNSTFSYSIGHSHQLFFLNFLVHLWIDLCEGAQNTKFLNQPENKQRKSPSHLQKEKSSSKLSFWAELLFSQTFYIWLNLTGCSGKTLLRAIRISPKNINFTAILKSKKSVGAQNPT